MINPFKRLEDEGSIDFQDKKNKVFSYLKYVIFLLPIIPLYFIISYYVVTYSDVESNIVSLAKKYVKNNDLNIVTETYIPLGALGEVEGAELCSNASGVIVTRSGNSYKYKAYLNCFDYETKLVSNSEKYIILSGDEVTLLNYGEIYEEKGYYSEDIVDVDVVGSVGTAPGIYTIEYKVKEDEKVKQTLTRKVIITEYDKSSTNSGVISAEAPTLTLRGDTTMILEKGEKFRDPGWVAVDYKDGKLNTSVVRTDNIKTNDMTKKVGTYELVYSVTNSRNVTVTKRRIVKVVEQKSDIVIESGIKKQTSGFAIELSISGTGYLHTILPDGEISEKNNISYKILKNGNYKFAVYDVYGNVTIRDIDVNDVDIAGPNGSCIASISNYVTNIYVSAVDKSGVSSYNYVIDGNSTGFIKDATYKSPREVKEVTVQAKDTYGNVSTYRCQVNTGRGSIINGIMNIPLILQTNYTKKVAWGNGKTATVKGYGCGPTSVSMIVAYLTGNVTQNPQIIFEWLNSLGYFHGYGFGKAALTKAASKYGVTCEWVNLTETQMKETLLSGKPIIAFMGKGTFSTGGHYIVLKGVTANGKIAINDPVSEKRSKNTYDANLILKEKRVSKAFAVCY